MFLPMSIMFCNDVNIQATEGPKVLLEPSRSRDYFHLSLEWNDRRALSYRTRVLVVLTQYTIIPPEPHIFTNTNRIRKNPTGIESARNSNPSLLTSFQYIITQTGVGRFWVQTITDHHTPPHTTLKHNLPQTNSSSSTPLTTALKTNP